MKQALQYILIMGLHALLTHMTIFSDVLASTCPKAIMNNPTYHCATIEQKALTIENLALLEDCHTNTPGILSPVN